MRLGNNQARGEETSLALNGNIIVCVHRLRMVDVNIISNANCRALNSLYNTKVVDTMMCASVPEGGKVD